LNEIEGMCWQNDGKERRCDRVGLIGGKGELWGELRMGGLRDLRVGMGEMYVKSW